MLQSKQNEILGWQVHCQSHNTVLGYSEEGAVSKWIVNKNHQRKAFQWTAFLELPQPCIKINFVFVWKWSHLVWWDTIHTDMILKRWFLHFFDNCGSYRYSRGPYLGSWLVSWPLFVTLLALDWRRGGIALTRASSIVDGEGWSRPLLDKQTNLGVYLLQG